MKEQNLTIENVEETIDGAIKRYFKAGMILDGIFWGMAIKLLKEKLAKED